MGKKIVKGLYCMAIMLLSVGAICVAPMIRGGQNESADAAGQSAESVNSVMAQGWTDAEIQDLGENGEGSNRWQDQFASSETMASVTLEKAPSVYDNNTYYISSANELAYVAYMVLTESTPVYAAYSYILKNDIDLSGSLWTPIGTPSNPFTGSFNGMHHSINGLIVAQASAINQSGSYYAGLFGYVRGVNTSSTTNAALISDVVLGSFNYVSTASTQYAGALIGYAGANTVVANVYDLRGDKSTYPTVGYAGGTGSKTSSDVYVYLGGSEDGKTAKYTTTTTISGTTTVKYGTYSSGYAISYDADGGNFYKQTTTSALGTVYPLYGSLYSTDFSAGVNVKYYGPKPVTRVNTTAANYCAAMKVGYTFTNFKVGSSQIDISSANSATLIANGLVAKPNWTAKNYTVNVNYGYGSPSTRTQTATIGNDTVWTTAFNSFDMTRLGYALAGKYFDAGHSNAVSGFVGDANGLSGSTYNVYLTWTANTNSFNLSLTNITTDTGFRGSDAVDNFAISGATSAAGTTYSYDLTSHRADTDVVLTFTLKAGYEFVGASTASTVYTTKPTLNAVGIYSVFGSAYYDTYNPVKYTVAIADTNKYTVTLSNIVGGGQVYFVFNRLNIDVTLSATNVNWSLSGNTAYTSLTGNKLTTKVGENFTLLATGSGANYYITYYDTAGVTSNNTAPSFTADTTGGQTTVPTGPSATKTYYNRYKLTFTKFGYTATNVSGRTITANANLLQVNVNVSISATENYAGSTKPVAGISNGTIDQITDGTYSGVAGLNDGKINVFMRQNAYFKIKSCSVNGTSVAISSLTTSTYSQDGREFMQYNYEFYPQFGDTYTIAFVAEPQTYSLNTKVMIDNQEASATQLSTYISAFTVTTGNAKPGSTTTYTLTQSAAGQAYLHLDSVTVDGSGSLSGNTFTFGVNNGTIVANFTSKTATFKLTATADIFGVNGTSGYGVLANNLVFKNAGGAAITSVGTAAGTTPGTLTLSGDVSSIDLVTGYYFLGWYLKNGSVYTLVSNEKSLTQALTNSNVIDLLKSSSDTNVQITLVPAVKQKTVTLSFTEGADPFDLISNKTSDADLSPTFLYYHNQELYGTKPVFSFTAYQNKFQRIGSSLSGWSTTIGDTTKTYTTTSNFTTQDLSDIYGSANAVTLTITPTWNAIAYNINIDSADASLTMYLGDTIEMVANANGSVTYKNKTHTAETTTSAQPGYTATSFIFGGKKNSSAVTTFKLSDDIISAYIPDAYKYTAGTAFTITTERDANPYKVYIDYTSYEILNLASAGLQHDDVGYYVQVTYNTAVSALGNVDLKRSGYQLVGYVNSANASDSFASLSGSTWTYKTYITTDNSHVKAVWEVSSNPYITVSTTNKTADAANPVYYTGTAQDVAIGAIATTGGDASIVGILPNGDQIDSYYWVKSSDTNMQVASGTTLALTSVSDSNNYQFVVKVKDTLSNTYYYVNSANVNIVINKNVMIANEPALQSYYTGSSTYIGTAASEAGELQYNLGTAQGNTVSGVNVTRFVIIDSTNTFSIGTGYTTRYYLNITKAIADNFNNIEGNETDGFYITVANSCTIVKTTIILTVSGQGFYLEGLKHTAAYATSNEQGVNLSGFDITANIMTVSDQVKVYNTKADFTVTLNVQKNSANVSANFDYAIAGSYKIETADNTNAYTYNYSVGYLTASNQTLNALQTSYADANYTLSISSISVDGEALADYKSTAAYYSYSKNGSTVLTLIGNGTGSLALAVRKGSGAPTVTFTIQVNVKTANANLTFLGFLKDSTDYAATLDAYTGAPSTATVVTASESAKINAVYTDASRVRFIMSLISVANPTAYYLSVGDVAGFEQVDWTESGFTFKGWQNNNGANLVITRDDTNKKSTLKIKKPGIQYDVISLWELQDPTFTTATPTVSKQASESAVTITFNELNSISNKGNIINYTYAWYNGNTLLGSDENLTFDSLSANHASANGNNYKVVVTAHFTSPTTSVAEETESEFAFTLAVTTNSITAIATTNDSFTYANKSYLSSINISINVNGTIKNYLLSASMDSSKPIYFTIQNSKGATVTDIKNADTYTVTLHVDSNVYSIAAGVNPLTIAVSTFNYELKDSDVSLGKVFGDADPALKTILTLNGENVTVAFTRAAGEAVGTYALTVNTVSSANYSITIPTNAWFQISKSTSNLFISLNAKLSMIYNGQVANKIVAVYADGQWVLQAQTAEGTVLASSNITLYYQTSDKTMTQVSANLDSALTGFTFAVNDPSKNVGNYALTASGTSVSYAGIEFYGAVTAQLNVAQAEINVNSIEKTFDETKSFSWTSTASDNTSVVTVSGLVTGETITITGSLSSELVGNAAASNIVLTDATGNYKLGTVTNEATIVASNVTVTVDTTNSSFEYGTITAANAVLAADMNSLLGLVMTANGAASAAFTKNYVTVTGVNVVSATYSTGNFLTVNTYDVTFTVTSANYTNANTDFTVSITVTAKGLDLSGTNISKEYDGTTDLPTNITWNMNGLMTGDIVSASGSYASATIGTNIAVSLTLTGTDASNYIIETLPTGEITSVALTFEAIYDSIDFVEDGVATMMDGSFAITYNGNAETFLSALAAKFGTRQGYTQNGWTFDKDGTQTLLNTSTFADFLAKAVASNVASGSYEIKAAWDINKVSVSINASYATIQVGDTTIANGSAKEINYFDSITFAIAGNAGYKYASYTFTGTSQSVTAPTGNTSNESLTITNVTASGTLTINMAEIEITVNADISAAPAAANASATWTSKTYNYSSASSTVLSLLPEVSFTAKTYSIDYWTYGVNQKIQVPSDATTLLSAIGGSATEDVAITFTAHWKAEDLSLVITATNATIIVKSGETVLTGVAGVYTAPYGANLSVTISGNEGFKYVSHTTTGTMDAIVATGENTKNATFSITGLKSDASLVITMSEIQITIQSNANVTGLIGTTVVSSWTEKTFNYSALNDTIGNTLTLMSVTAGTYTQVQWQYTKGETTTSLALTENLLDFVKTTVNGGELTKDITFTVLPVWEGVSYTVHFDANGGTLTGDAALTVAYGSSITGMPIASKEGMYNSWNTQADGNGSSYSEGSALQTIGTIGDSGYEITLYAKWDAGLFELTLDASDTNILSVTIGGKTIANGDVIKVVFGSDVEIFTTYKTGYQLNTASSALSITAAGTLAFNGNTITLRNLNQDATLTIVSELKTYQLKLDVSTYETYVSGANGDATNGYYTTVKYNDLMQGSSLENVVVVRAGYTFTGWATADGSFATVTDGVWSYTNANYTTDADTILMATWMTDKSYVTANAGSDFSAYYNGTEQTATTGSVRANGADATLNSILANGDKITAIYFATGTAASPVKFSDGIDLKLTTVSTDSYFLVVEVIDQLSKDRFGTNATYSICSASITATIQANEVNVSGYTYESYYTGTNAYVGTVSSVLGNLTYKNGGTAISDASVSKVEFIDSTNAFLVRGAYDVRVYVSISASAAANFSNINGDAATGYYVTLTGVGTIVATPIVLTAEGAGFYTGEKHQIDATISTEIAGIDLSKFILNARLSTKDATVGDHSAFDVVRFVATKAGVDVASNFAVTTAGTYTILSAASAYTVNLGTTYLTLSGDTLALNNTYSDFTLRINNLTVNGEAVAVEGDDFMNYYDGSTLVFTLSGNNSANAVITVNNTYNVVFNVTVRGSGKTIQMLDWTTDITLETLKSTLQGLAVVANKTETVTVDATESLYAVLSDVKAINLSYGDKTGNDYVYAKVGDATGTTLTVPTWQGFTFANWDMTGLSNLTLTGNTLTVNEEASILPVTIPAKWTLAKPTASLNAQTITFKADGTTYEVAIADVIGSISNTNDAIVYSYAWYQEDGTLLGNGNTLSLISKTTSAGNYYVVITASKTGYTAQVSEHITFTVSVTKSTLSASSTSADTFTYANKNYAADIEIVLNINGTEITKKLSELLADGTIQFSIMDGANNVTAIQNVGNYTITMSSDSTVYDMTAYSANFAVTPASYVIKQADVAGLNKYFGGDDPTLSIDLTLNDETITVTFTREAGENLGTYELFVNTVSSTNYTISIASGNKYFEIKQATGVLRLEVTNAEVLNKVYNGKTTVLKAELKDGTWNLNAYDADDLVTPIASSVIKLYIFAEGTLSELMGAGYPSALENVTFSLPTNNQNAAAEGYEISIVINAGANFTEINFVNTVKFTVSQKGIAVTSVAKTFDASASFDSDANTVVTTGVVTGETVKVAGAFSAILAGANVAIDASAWVLSGDDSANYYLDIDSSVTVGTINANDTVINFTLDNTSFTYGKITKTTTLDGLLVLFGHHLTANITGTDEDVANFITVKSFAVEDAVYSSGNYLNANTYEFSITLESTNLSKANGTFKFNIGVSTIDLDLSTATVEKVYDGTTTLPNVAWDLSQVLTGDTVVVSGTYNNKEVGTDKDLSLSLTGVDAVNYSIANQPKGSITATTVRFTVDATTLASFVDDGEDVKTVATLFDITYPNTQDAAALLATMVYPTRTGYTVTGWSYTVDGTNYTAITAANLSDVLDIAFENEKTLTIYANWKINKVSVTVNAANATVTTTGATGSANVYSVDYYADITFTVAGDAGYKLADATITSGAVGTITVNGKGTRTNGSIILNHVKSDSVLTVAMEELTITVNIDSNVPANTTLVHADWTSKDFAYSTTDVAAWGLLPEVTVTAGTYRLTSWGYGSGSTLTDGSITTLREVFGADIDEDTTITFTAGWTGENYVITFDPTDGQITNGVNAINAIYGSAMNNTFAIAELAGKSNRWNTASDNTGITYKQDDVLSTIGSMVDDHYELTLYAIWSNMNYDLTVSFTDAAITAVQVDGRNITSGDLFNIVYNETELVLTVSTAAGYTFNAALTNEADGLMVVNNNNITVSDIIKDSTLTISAVAKENTLTVTPVDCDIETVKINNSEVTKSNIIKANTGVTVEITFVAKAGFEFTDESTVVLNGSGSIVQEIKDGKLVITWTNFVADATLTVQAVPETLHITLADSSVLVGTIKINGESLLVSGDTFNTTTGTTLNIEVILKYGYENIGLNITGTDELTYHKGTETFDETNKVFKCTFEISGFTKGFNFTITADAREYQVQAVSDNPSMGTVSPTTVETIAFGGSQNYVATPGEGYILVGWYANDTLISSNKNLTLTLDDTLKDALENADPMILHAKFSVSEKNVTLVTSTKGSLAYSVDDGETLILNADATVTKTLNYESTLYVTTNPQQGYEVAEVKFYNVLGDLIPDNGWYDATTGTLTVFVDESAPARFEVIFTASDALISVKAGVQINYTINYGTDLGGTIFASDADGNEFRDDSHYAEVTKSGVDYKLLTKTDKVEYFVVHVNAGYTFVLKSDNPGVIISQTTMASGDLLFEVNGLYDGVLLSATFTAADNTVMLYFVNADGEKVPAGKIAVDTSSSKVVAAGNDSAEVMVSVLTGTDISFVVSSNLSYTLKNEGGYVDVSYSEGFESAINAGLINNYATTENGFSENATITISNIHQNATIYIYAVAKTYNVEFVSYDDVTDKFIKIGETLREVSYGKQLPITPTLAEQLAISRDGFVFQGYFTKELGQGKQYVDVDGLALGNWEESAYVWNGTVYEPAANYSEATNTFTLYASWYYLKENITINFVPEGLKDSVEGITVGDIVTSLNSESSWTSADNLFYAEVKSGVSIEVTAYPFAGFSFQYWLIDRGNGDVITNAGQKYTYTATTGEVTITAVYFANHTITMDKADGGEAYVTQDGRSLGAVGSFDTTKPISLVAKANAGYKFMGWIDNTTGNYLMDNDGNVIVGDYDSTAKTYTHTLPENREESLDLTAIFEGSEVGVLVDLSEFSGKGTIQSISIEGTEIYDWSSEFEARVGDTIRIALSMGYGYGVRFDSLIFSQPVGTYGVYDYKIVAKDLSIIPGTTHEGILVVKPIADPQIITYRFEFRVEGVENPSELDIAGQVSYKDDTGSTVIVTKNSRLEKLFGTTIRLDVNFLTNYKLGYVHMDMGGREVDISEAYSDPIKQIILSSTILEEHNAAPYVTVIVNFARMIWTDYRSEGLEGKGTSSNPYIVTTAEDMAFVAYAVNNGLIHEKTGLAYADAYYNVTKNLDFTGKYWIPIGTEANPFNGIINMNTYSVTGITHYMTYLPRTFYEGLLWFMTDNAQVIEANNSLVIALSVTAGVVAAGLAILAIVLIVRHRKKKKLDELANS